jgi:hypothetical protein
MELENNTPTEGTEETQKPELSAAEQEALDAGWVPKEEFNGEEHKWVDAAEFLRRGELFKKIEVQNRELKDVKRALVEMKKLHSSVREVEYKRALETLRAQKKSALEDGDADAVLAADDRIDMIKEEQRKLQSEPEIQIESGEQHPVFVEWTARNSWYTTQAPMKAFADALGAELARDGLTPPQVLKKVEEEVRKEFPNRFRNPRQDRPSGVESSTPRGQNSSSFQLSPDERRIMNNFVRQNVMTEAEYIKELKKVKGL